MACVPTVSDWVFLNPSYEIDMCGLQEGPLRNGSLTKPTAGL